jgi:hypothetical protein
MEGGCIKEVVDTTAYIKLSTIETNELINQFIKKYNKNNINEFIFDILNEYQINHENEKVKIVCNTYYLLYDDSTEISFQNKQIKSIQLATTLDCNEYIIKIQIENEFQPYYIMHLTPRNYQHDCNNCWYYNVLSKII